MAKGALLGTGGESERRGFLTRTKPCCAGLSNPPCWWKSTEVSCGSGAGVEEEERNASRRRARGGVRSGWAEGRRGGLAWAWWTERTDEGLEEKGRVFFVEWLYFFFGFNIRDCYLLSPLSNLVAWPQDGQKKSFLVLAANNDVGDLGAGPLFGLADAVSSAGWRESGVGGRRKGAKCLQEARIGGRDRRLQSWTED